MWGIYEGKQYVFGVNLAKRKKTGGLGTAHNAHRSIEWQKLQIIHYNNLPGTNAREAREKKLEF